MKNNNIDVLNNKYNNQEISFNEYLNAICLEYLKKNINKKDFFSYLKSVKKYIDKSFAGNLGGRISYLDGAEEEIKNLLEEDMDFNTNLREYAIICDIFNNLVHCLPKEEETLKQAFFGLKNTMIKEIIKECERVGSISYGKTFDEERKTFGFVVDIPEIGQVKWHTKKELRCKEYKIPLKKIKEENKGAVSNKSLLLQKTGIETIKSISKHIANVTKARSIDEVNLIYQQELQHQLNSSKSTFTQSLSEMVNPNPPPVSSKNNGNKSEPSKENIDDITDVGDDDSHDSI